MKDPGQLEFAFVLHSRAWRETSLIVDIFTENYGRLALCVRGARSATGKRSSKQSMLQPLTPLLISWQGRGDLPLMTQLEGAGPSIRLSSDALYSAFYLNELLIRLLHRHDPHAELFHQYQNTLQQLSLSERVEIPLREFELVLLKSLGYGLSLDYDNTGEKISHSHSYVLDIDGLFQRDDVHSKGLNKTTQSVLFKGEHLISIREKNWQNSAVLTDAKRLIRLSLRPLLGGKPLNSRKLFRSKN